MIAKPRNFRRRAGADDGDEDDNPAATNNGPSTTAAAKSTAPKPKKLPTQTPKLLSFADDEDDGAGDGTRARSRSSRPSGSGRTSSSSSHPAKPPSAHTLTSLKDRVFHSSSSSSSSSTLSRSLTSNVQPQAGTYTLEALRELQKNTRTLAASSKPSPEPVIVLKGLIRPAEQANSSDSEEDEARNGGDGEASASVGIGGGKGRDSDSAVIPDRAMIEAIRAKRERLRQSRAAAPDFISLDAGSNHGEAVGLSDEEPENLSRIAILGEKAEGPRKGVFEGFDERAAALEVVVSEEEEEAEEEKIWEEEQFRKGLGKSRVDDSGVGVPAAQRDAQQMVAHPGGARAAVASASIGGAFGGSSQGLGLGMMSISQQGEIAKKALLDNVRKLKVC